MPNLYQDVYLEDAPDRLVFGNSRLKVELGKKAGEWLSFTADGVDGDILAPPAGEKGPAPFSAAADFRIDGQWMVQRHGAALVSHHVSVDRLRRFVSLSLVLGVLPRSGPAPKEDKGSSGAAAAAPAVYEYEFTVTYHVYPGEMRIDRSARLVRSAATCPAESAARRLEGFQFLIPGAHLGDTADCVVDVPGPWFPKSWVRPATPYPALAGESIGFHGAPDGGFGVLAVSNTRRNVTLASWMDTAGECGYQPSIRGDGKHLTLVFSDHRAYRLAERMAVESDRQQLHLAGGLPAALQKYRIMATETMPLDPRTPAWVREMVILEILPTYFKGGLKEITQKLPFYRDIGVNTVYLMPHWLGGYSPIDLYKVDPSLGTAEDLKALVRAAHGLGMRVLFDMVIHGFNEKSPVVQERPDLFIHNEDGTIARHPAWKSMSTDWAAPAYRQYMVDLVLHDQRVYDVDGYRVDAASFKGANWDPKSRAPAYRSGAASPELMEQMLDAMRRGKPEAIMLNEVFGPVFYVVSNLSHDNQTEAPQQFIERMDAGETTAADYKTHMANTFAMLPQGANRVFFARNHDTSWFYHFNGYTPRFMALDAVHVLCTIPEVFAGDPRHGPHPDSDPATWDYYRKVFALRKEFPELARGELLLREVSCDNPQVFTGLRRLDGTTALVVVSLSDKTESAAVTLPPPAPQGVKLRDALTGEPAVAAGEGPAVQLKLEAFQVLVGRV